MSQLPHEVPAAPWTNHSTHVCQTWDWAQAQARNSIPRVDWIHHILNWNREAAQVPEKKSEELLLLLLFILRGNMIRPIPHPQASNPSDSSVVSTVQH